jgi:hypothetical protein
MDQVTLFQLENEDIKITIEAYFDAAGNLVVEGYDIGKIVKEYWGDIDYEYSVAVHSGEVKKLYSLFQVPEGDRMGLLNSLRERYHSNTCFSQIRELLVTTNIRSEGFSWI